MGTRSAIAAPRILCSRGLRSGSARATGSGVERSPSAANPTLMTSLRTWPLPWALPSPTCLGPPIPPRRQRKAWAVKSKSSALVI
ncbi:complement C2 [Homo sapiens]|uniref:Complement C2 n=1 Tax=Homo sapiens TaxID=9606 RepID=F2Z306_HUMAN|nr:complement C2 [Homo sapiens]KAI2541722.1 complement C2 [Homo sapiens]KAI4017680.1 complement C2 [Homo sapiens]KAI4017682.1 complement C2 [Homo sapiens]